jgi:hypothetical protein
VLTSLSSLLSLLLKMGAVAMVANEIRGLVLAAPVLYGIYQSGGTLTAIWLGISSLGGIALSVVVPIFAARRLKRRFPQKPRTEAQPA